VRICEVLELGTCEVLELGTCEVLESRICGVRGSGEVLIQKPKQAVMFVKKRFGIKKDPTQRRHLKKSGFEV
jgi:hypothetical protein